MALATPAFQQLTGLVTYLRTQLRADSYLVTGDAGTDLGATADQICKGITTHKMFEAQGDSLALYVELGKMNFPALSIYIESAEHANVDGGLGFDCQLGVQYIFEAQARDQTSQAFAAHFSMAIWWAICSICRADMQAETSTLQDTYHIQELGLDGMRLLPPLNERVRAFEATGSMLFKRPMWDTGTDSHQVVTLASIYTDHNETGDTGADALAQSIHTPA